MLSPDEPIQSETYVELKTIMNCSVSELYSFYAWRELFVYINIHVLLYN